MIALAYVLLGVAAAGLVLLVLGVVATVRHTARPPYPLPAEAPPITLLKPLRGLEEGLDENLESFFTQDYPAAVEVLFSTLTANDPALAVARRVADRHPEVVVRYVVADPDYGMNPKVASLAAGYRATRTELVLQSDANVRVESSYLSKIVAELLAEDAALLSSLVVGVGERSLGAFLHNLQLSAFTAPGTCFAVRYFGIVVVIGKSMLFRRSELEAIGGFGPVRDVLAEDYVLGRLLQARGRKVVLSASVVRNVNERSTVQSFLSRHARWLKMRAVVHVPGFLVDLVANPVGVGLAAVLVSGFDPRVLGLFGVLVLAKTAADAYLVWRTRRVPVPWRFLPLAPLRGVLLAMLWPYCAVSRSIDWRGSRLRLGMGSRLRADEGFFAVRWARRVWAYAFS